MWAIKSAISFRNMRDFRKSFPIDEDELLLIWEEHCTECFVPTCYSTCALYAKRYDGKCERFSGGIHLSSGETKYLSFKRWAKLESKFNVGLYGLAVNAIAFYGYFFLRNILFMLPESKLRNRLFGAMNVALYRTYEMISMGESKNSFVLSIELKPDIRVRSMQVEIVTESGSTMYKERIVIESLVGSMEVKIGSLLLKKGIIRITVDEDADYHFSFYDLKLCLDRQIPHNFDERENQDELVKIVFWDLDNTIWDGILTEGAVIVRENIRKIILRLNDLGIVNVISSKNDFDAAAEKMREFELYDLFVGHQINWEPKSSNILELLKTLNLRPNNAVFVDDSAFEREEVKLSIPQIVVYNEIQILNAVNSSKFNSLQSSESKNRIESYLSLIHI